MPVLLFAAFNQTVWVAYLYHPVNHVDLAGRCNRQLATPAQRVFLFARVLRAVRDLDRQQLRPSASFRPGVNHGRYPTGFGPWMILLALPRPTVTTCCAWKGKEPRPSPAAQQREVAVLKASERELEAACRRATAELTATLQHLEHTRDDLIRAEKLVHSVPW